MDFVRHHRGVERSEVIVALSLKLGGPVQLPNIISRNVGMADEAKEIATISRRWKTASITLPKNTAFEAKR